jgi:hypothetical protein
MPKRCIHATFSPTLGRSIFCLTPILVSVSGYRCQKTQASPVKSVLFAAGRQRFNHPRLRITILLRTSCIFPPSTKSTPDVTTSLVTSLRPPKPTPRARRRPRGGSCARQLVEVLLQDWSAMGESGQASIRFGVDQARRHPRCVFLQSRSDEGADKFRGLPYFLRAKGPDCPPPSTPSCCRSTLYEVGAQTGANVHEVVPASAQRG